jgi:hypothetical protein
MAIIDPEPGIELPELPDMAAAGAGMEASAVFGTSDGAAYCPAP